jgi:hypothetical protein
MNNMKHQHTGQYITRYGIGSEQKHRVMSAADRYKKAKREHEITKVLIETVAAVVVGGILILILSIGA